MRKKWKVSPFVIKAQLFLYNNGQCQRAWQSLGGIRYTPSIDESKSLIFRRSIYVSKDIAKGDLLSSENLKIIRPGDGLPPSYFNDLIGRRSPRSYKAGTPFSLDMFFE